MNKAIVLLDPKDDPGELREYFTHHGYVARVVSNKTELIGNLAAGTYNSVFLEVNSLSDILLLDKIRSLSAHLEIVIVVKHPLKEVISILQGGDFRTILDITKLQHKATDDLAAIGQGD